MCPPACGPFASVQPSKAENAAAGICDGAILVPSQQVAWDIAGEVRGMAMLESFCGWLE